MVEALATFAIASGVLWHGLQLTPMSICGYIIKTLELRKLFSSVPILAPLTVSVDLNLQIMK